MGRSSVKVATFALVFCCLLLSTEGQLLNLGGMLNWTLGISGTLTSSLLAPITATTNVVIGVVGTFTVTITRLLNLGNLSIGGAGSNPTLNVAAGVTATVNGNLNLTSGAINLGAGATLNIMGALFILGPSPVTITIGQGATLNVGTISVSGVALGGNLLTVLTVQGSGILNLQNVDITINSANVIINLPATIGINTDIDTIGAASITFGSLLNVIGDVDLDANFVLNSGATLVFNGVTAGLNLLTANLMVGAQVVAAVNGTAASTLNVAGTLNLGAALTVVGSVASNVVVVVTQAATITGSFAVAANAGFSILATPTTILVATS